MSSNALFSPLKIGHMDLQHRVVLAPLTRNRADDDFVPNVERMKEYYGQRASVPGTFLITEATPISLQATGYPNLPGIYNEKQVAAWREITDEVHRKGSFIYLQLWHMGRAVLPFMATKLGTKIISASNIPIDSKAAEPAAMTEEEIHQAIKEYANAAANAIKAGFDGVEIHAANGYLIDQFTQDVSNNRTDAWGGSVENRARFCLQVSEAVVKAVGNDGKKVGIRFSPFSSFQSMKMQDPEPQFTHIIKELKKLHLAYIHVVESRISGTAEVETTEKINFAIEPCAHCWRFHACQWSESG